MAVMLPVMAYHATLFHSQTPFPAQMLKKPQEIQHQDQDQQRKDLYLGNGEVAYFCLSKY